MATVVRAGDCYTCQILAVPTAPAAALATGNYVIATACAHGGQVARYVTIMPETDAVRFKCNGSAPAANCGMILATNDILMLDSIQQIQNFKCINTSAGLSSTAVIFFFF